jgi:hypothetical protein
MVAILPGQLCIAWFQCHVLQAGARKTAARATAAAEKSQQQQEVSAPSSEAQRWLQSVQGGVKQLWGSERPVVSERRVV